MSDIQERLNRKKNKNKYVILAKIEVLVLFNMPCFLGKMLSQTFVDGAILRCYIEASDKHMTKYV